MTDYKTILGSLAIFRCQGVTTLRVEPRLHLVIRWTSPALVTTSLYIKDNGDKSTDGWDSAGYDIIQAMADLTQMKCEPCRVGAPTLSDDQISEFSSQTPNWEVLDDQGVKKLQRSFKFKNFQQALDFVNKVGEIAEQEGHHPEIQFGWGHATITWWTHKINGLHQNDFIMAAKTNQLITNG